MDLQELASREFQDQFGRVPSIVVRVPGRLNLIGQHTDYNDGFVLPLAIDRAIWIALGPRSDGLVVAHAADLEDTADFSLDNLQNTNEDGPSN
jgi:galactokinase